MDPPAPPGAGWTASGFNRLWRWRQPDPDARDPRARLFNWLSAVLFFWLLVRIILVVGATPIVANANNYDFVRQSACVGAWMHYSGGKPKEASSPMQPVDALTFDGDHRKDVCLPSSDNIFPWAITLLHQKHETFPLHQVGRLKAAAAAGLVLAILLIPMTASCRLAIAVAATLTLGDFILLLFFNTLYLEASFVIFGLGALVMSWLIFAKRTPPGRAYVLWLAAILFAFAFARQQYAFFAIGLSALSAAGMARWRTPRRAAALGLAAALSLGGLAYLDAHKNAHAINAARANIADTVLGAVLPAASDKPRALTILGLPPQCAGAIGLDWYQAGFNRDASCPGVFGVSRLRLVRLFFSDPATLWTPLRRAAMDAQFTGAMPFVAHFERPADFVNFKFQVISMTSLTALLYALPPSVFAVLIMGSILAGVVGLGAFVWLSSGRRAERWNDDRAASLLAGLGGSLALYSIVSSVFGDGYVELGRHAIGVALGLALQLGALVFWLACRWLRPAPGQLAMTG